jgi:hypothetical protein
LKTIDCTTVSVRECRKTYKPFKFIIGDERYVMFEWKNTVLFTAKPVNTSVFVACSYDNWAQHEMSYQGKKEFPSK